MIAIDKILNNILRNKTKNDYSKNYYYGQQLYPQSLEDFLKILDNKNERFYKTNKTIKFKDIDFGDSVKEVIKNYGKPKNLKKK